MSEPRECVICKAPICDGHLMCREHWNLLPRDQRHELYAAYRRFRSCQNGRFLKARLAAYGKAREKAIATVHKQLAA